MPEKGTQGTALDRSGKPVCQAEVVSVRAAKALDHTALLTMRVPKEYACYRPLYPRVRRKAPWKRL